MECSTVLDEIEIPQDGGEGDVLVEEGEIKSLRTRLKGVKDKRHRRGRRYEAAMVLVLILLAKLAGEKSILGVAEWVRYRKEWLKEALAWKREDFPCANTYTNVCQNIEIDELNRCVGDFFAEKHGSVLVEAEPRNKVDDTSGENEVEKEVERGKEHLATDGKSIRGSRRISPERKEGLQVLGLYNVTYDFMLRQTPIAGKGHERSAGLALLSDLDLRGTVVSADALHTQPKWCKQVLAQGGDYIAIAKGNQSELYSDIALLFSQPPQGWLPEVQARTTEKAHGRLEIRHLRASSQLNDYLADKWSGVQQVFSVERRITRRGIPTCEVALGITSLPLSLLPAPDLLALVRAHWHIENRSHWRRDVTLGEDDCKVATGQVPRVLASLNNAVLALFDFLHVDNVARQMRLFSASPQRALTLLLDPL